ncbi:hypothetical protein K7X08_001622 [Anisodus acutangulus]|uniref:Uncharacterized protein n=1 Tax=Anisodus acutangulus TaxID=402998 RepID=A0A9Q1LMN8_9SOLA|nr:hypothetical protein K7X08_001622 [Anisodus acutangulus]
MKPIFTERCEGGGEATQLRAQTNIYLSFSSGNSQNLPSVDWSDADVPFLVLCDFNGVQDGSVAGDTIFADIELLHQKLVQNFHVSQQAVIES